MPHLALIEQALITGILAGGLYGLLALGLSLSWGLLRLVNLGHFAMALLGRLLESEGYRVAILSQPDWRSCGARKTRADRHRPLSQVRRLAGARLPRRRFNSLGRRRPDGP